MTRRRNPSRTWIKCSNSPPAAASRWSTSHNGSRASAPRRSQWTDATSMPRGIASSASTSPTICSSTTSRSSAEVTSPQHSPDPAPQVITHVRRRRGAIAAHRFEHLFESLGFGAGQLLHQKGKRGRTLADDAFQHLWLTLHQCEINLRAEPLRLLPDGLLQIAPCRFDVSLSSMALAPVRIESRALKPHHLTAARPDPLGLAQIALQHRAGTQSDPSPQNPLVLGQGGLKDARCLTIVAQPELQLSVVITEPVMTLQPRGQIAVERTRRRTAPGPQHAL